MTTKFDDLTDLENALIRIRGLARLLYRLGLHTGEEAEVFGYLGAQLSDYEEAAREAFGRLHSAEVKEKREPAPVEA
jgi:hypothetical protein